MIRIKQDASKIDWTLLPVSEIEGVLSVIMFGARKYARDNWKELKDGERMFIAAAYRHLGKHLKGEVLDDESGLEHLAHAATSILFAIWHSKAAERHPIPGEVLKNTYKGIAGPGITTGEDV